MSRRWPDFALTETLSGLWLWSGPVRPIQRQYEIAIFWRPGSDAAPIVMVTEPRLRPRPGGSYKEIPHLIYDDDEPWYSDLCLFDPDGNEWKPNMQIADTTVPWASEWLSFYEMWRLDGVWRGKSVGPESIAEIERARLHAEARELVKDAT